MQIRNATIFVLVGLAALGTFIVAPRPTRTRALPLPRVDVAALRAREAEEEKLARGARQSLLPTRTRIVGEEFRRLGLILARHGDATALHFDLKADVNRLLRDGHAAELLTLRALQSELFVEAVRGWEESGHASSELHELGGDFEEIATASFRRDGRSIELNDQQLRLLFRVRWGRLTGVHRIAPFGPDLEEMRRYYAVQLEHPTGGHGLDPRSRALVQLEAATALASIDPDYPGELARGLLLLRAGEAHAAAESLKRHLTLRPHGAWSLVARNALLSALTEPSAW